MANKDGYITIRRCVCVNVYLGSIQGLVVCVVADGSDWRRQFLAMSRLLPPSGSALPIPAASC